jgi:hypothetical protein
MKIKSLLTAALLIAVVISCSASISQAGSPAPGGTGYLVVVLPVTGAVTTTTAKAVSFVAPAGYQIQSAVVTAGVVSGTNPTMKVRGSTGSYVNYSGTCTAANTPTAMVRTFTAGAASGVVTSIPPRMAAGSLHTVDLVLGGSNPSFSNPSITLFLRAF